MKEIEGKNAENTGGPVILDKKIGETPLECLERFRAEKIAADPNGSAGIWSNMPMTYAGRLDPLASGALLVLFGEECKNKEKYLGLDKEYEVEILFGVKTDTGDLLGLIEKVNETQNETGTVTDFPANFSWTDYIGQSNQEYPAYSSKTVGGKQLHALARAGELPDEMPTKQIEIYSIEKIGERKIFGNDLAKQAVEAVSKVHGDFRQQEIIEGWKTFSEKHGRQKFFVIKLRIACSSGTYMRSLAERIGRDTGTGALAFSIHRTQIGGF